MTSEWMKIMLDEIARKAEEAERGRIEAERRRAELAPGCTGDDPDDAAADATDPAQR
ncbi:MAG: hypothetical protein NVSMB10_05840 [Steroidobacteraceae bacterium]